MKQPYFFITFLIILNSFAQNTVGTIKNEIGSFNGYTLFAPLTSTETYLINNCGQVVHQWTTTNSTNSVPSASVYLLENGTLLRTGKISNSDIVFGGVGGKIELFDWDNTLLWEYTYSTNEVSQHHDVFPLPNGNILMLAVSTITEEEAIQAGRDPSKIADGKIFNEQILELEPFGTDQANIVWQWNMKDHLIQDFDATKDNYGVVADNPQLLDINYLNNDTASPNWLHFNSMQYNAALDQIILSTRILSEVYIIDHSTTTSEAAVHTGGIYGKGGDFLYRWGNPEAYRHGFASDRILFGQHFPHWIPDELTDAGKIMIFNNGPDRLFSSIEIIDPPISTPGFYNYLVTTGYPPSTSEWTYKHPEPKYFFSAIISSAQRLPNGNTLICDGDSGFFFEIDINENIVWEYINPVTNLGAISQGEIAHFNLVFRAHKFAQDYPAFSGRDLTPGDPIELNFDISSCQVLSVSEYNITNQLNIYPNPSLGSLNISTELPIDKVEIYDVFGKLLLKEFNTIHINIEKLNSGIYFVKIYSDSKIGTKKIIKK